MPDIAKGTTFTSGQTVTAALMNTLVDDAVINDNAITTDKLAANSVTSAKISSSAAIAYSKLAALSGGNLVVGDMNNVATRVALSGDATMSNTGSITIGDGAVPPAKVLDANITTAKLADSTGASDGVTTAKLATGAVTPAKLEAGTQGDVLYFGSGGTAARLGAGSDGQFLQSGGAGADPSWASNPAFETETFTADGTWTKPAGATWVQVTVVGGGGAGGTGSTNQRGQAGGHGGYGVDWVDISGESTVSVTVGSGGGVGVGESGGQSSFGSYVVSTGGAEGTGDVEAETAKSTQAACGTVTFDARDTGLSLNKQPSAPGSYAIPTIASVGAKGAGGLEQYDNGTAPAAGSDGFVTVRVVG